MSEEAGAESVPRRLWMVGGLKGRVQQVRNTYITGTCAAVESNLEQYGLHSAKLPPPPPPPIPKLKSRYFT